LKNVKTGNLHKKYVQTALPPCSLTTPFDLRANTLLSPNGVDTSSRRINNPALNLAPFSRWTLRDKTAQRRFALR